MRWVLNPEHSLIRLYHRAGGLLSKTRAAGVRGARVGSGRVGYIRATDRLSVVSALHYKAPIERPLLKYYRTSQ